MFVLCPKQNKFLGLASIHYDDGIVQVTNKLRRVCARINSGQIHKICHLSFLKRSSPEDCQWGPNNSSYVEKEFWLWWVVTSQVSPPQDKKRWFEEYKIALAVFPKGGTSKVHIFDRTCSQNDEWVNPLPAPSVWRWTIVRRIYAELQHSDSSPGAGF